MQKAIFIFDAGGTKTDVLSLQQGETKKYSLPGFNPNRKEKEFLSAINELNISENSQVYFYGAGIKPAQHKDFLRTLMGTSDIFVNDDLLGAARASFGDKKGAVVIMGTGANIGYYNGKTMLDQRGGYGYLIDDLGGGYELGKKIVSAWLSGDLNEQTNQVIQDYICTPKENFITTFYQNIDLGLLAGLCKIVLPEIEKDPNLKTITLNYFDVFVKTHLIPFSNKHHFNSISCVGSIAFYYKKYITIAFSKNGIRIDSILLKPITELFKFHLTKL
ncbi:hypothetical protein DNU06_13895 [Putridiphycobacter roseus]|uniref:N-acetylglucosamine kinase n=1 Tax=Putridiphycobacter roseus TaxID=2219161 RepID=A0A2W1NDR8_9FLAO|nr:hypothetical protein [Putridiphycobacter roseus]PZE16216.1 hypothetical protein DNU06_13895 [Putridiphycobacter roseus]